MALNNLNSFLSGYKFEHKNSIDTIEVIKTVRNGEAVVQHVISMGTDGITIKGNLENEGNNKTFEF
ncbi:hypothetical protein V6R21_10270 [Limibacter armeniacum]|uniref:hypothetical protein n=1 Tax=Limibacter armeniacum TaxID=466084 RepID=UPI002FE52005